MANESSVAYLALGIVALIALVGLVLTMSSKSAVTGGAVYVTTLSSGNTQETQMPDAYANYQSILNREQVSSRESYVSELPKNIYG